MNKVMSGLSLLVLLSVTFNLTADQKKENRRNNVITTTNIGNNIVILLEDGWNNFVIWTDPGDGLVVWEDYGADSTTLGNLNLGDKYGYKYSNLTLIGDFGDKTKRNTTNFLYVPGILDSMHFTGTYGGSE
ncbi:MAG: hypothetical protein HY606_03625 [Planctomycetes bacterium]|nr:hypothetical protein [Planctomycetota bacterium]